MMFLPVSEITLRRVRRSFTVRSAASTDEGSESNIPGQQRRSVRSRGEREREREIRKRRDERQRLAGRREREVLAQSVMNGAEQPLPISHRCDRKYTERNSFHVFSTSD